MTIEPITSKINRIDETWMQEAYLLAKKAEAIGEVPIGAVIVHGDAIIGRGYNQTISSHDPTAHAEILAIKEACLHQANYRLEDCTLYTTLEPCIMCAGAIIHSRVKRLVIGALDKKRGAVVSNLSLLSSMVSNHLPQIDWGIYEKPCSQLLSQFFARRREEIRNQEK